MRRFMMSTITLLVLVGCSVNKNYTTIPKGATTKSILIKSEPTESIIYIDDQYLGKTPIRTKFWFTKERMVNIKAVPFYESQYTQNIYIRIPPIPDEMTVYLDYEYFNNSGITLSEEDVEEMVVQKEETVDSVQIIREVIVETDTLFQPIILPILFFETDMATLPDAIDEILVDVIEIMSENTVYSLEIIGSADRRGSNDYNRNLAKERATNVWQRLLELGIETERMSIVIQVEHIVTDEKDEDLPFRLQRTVGFRLITE